MILLRPLDMGGTLPSHPTDQDVIRNQAMPALMCGRDVIGGALPCSLRRFFLKGHIFWAVYNTFIIYRQCMSISLSLSLFVYLSLSRGSVASLLLCHSSLRFLLCLISLSPLCWSAALERCKIWSVQALTTTTSTNAPARSWIWTTKTKPQP